MEQERQEGMFKVKIASCRGQEKRKVIYIEQNRHTYSELACVYVGISSGTTVNNLVSQVATATLFKNIPDFTL